MRRRLTALFLVCMMMLSPPLQVLAQEDFSADPVELDLSEDADAAGEFTDNGSDISEEDELTRELMADPYEIDEDGEALTAEDLEGPEGEDDDLLILEEDGEAGISDEDQEADLQDSVLSFENGEEEIQTSDGSESGDMDDLLPDDLLLAWEEPALLEDSQDEERHIEYDYEPGRTLYELPYWGIWVNRYGAIRAYIRNSEYPDGQDFVFQVTGVTISGDGSVASIDEREDGWQIDFNGMGEETMTISYLDEHNNAAWYDVPIVVSGDVYDVWYDLSTGSDWIQPGKSMDLYARIRHERYTDHHENVDTSQEDISFEWEILSGEEFVEGTADPQDPAVYRLKAIDTESDEWNEVNIRLSAYVTDADGNRFFAGDSTRVFHIQNDYHELYPAGIEDLMPGQSQTVTVDFMRNYREADGSYAQESIPDEFVRFFWEYNMNQVMILDDEGEEVAWTDGPDEEGNVCAGFSGNNRQFTIIRTGTGETWFRIRTQTDWEQNGNWRDDWERNYHFGWPDMDCWYEDLREGDHTFVFEDEQVSFPIVSRGLEGIDYKVRTVAGYGEGEDENWHFVELPGADFITDSNGFVTIDGAGMMADETVLERGYVEFMSVLSFVNARGEDTYLMDKVSWAGLLLNETSYDYEYRPDQTYNVLPWWGRWIEKNGAVRCRVQNKDYPYGCDFNCEITAVDTEGNNGIVDIDERENGWQFDFRDKPGEVTVHVSYIDPYGSPGEYSFRFAVGGDYYDIGMDFPEGSDHLQDQETICVSAWCYHEAYSEKEGHHIVPTDNVVYEWSIVHGNEYSQAAADPEDSSKCYITAARLDDDEHQKVTILLKAFEQDGEGNLFEVGQNERDLWIGREYHELFPAVIDDIPLASYRDVNVCYEHFYRSGSGEPQRELVEDKYLNFEWEYNADQVLITDLENHVIEPDEGPDENGNARIHFTGNGRSFRIWRLTRDEFHVRLTSWNDFDQDGNWEEDCGRDYGFGGSDTDLWYEDLRMGDYTYVYEDETVRIPINGRGFVPADCSVKTVAGYAEGEGENWHVNVLEESDDILTSASDSVTMNGAAMAANQTVRENGGVGIYTTVSFTDASGRQRYLIDRYTWVELRRNDIWYEFDYLPGSIESVLPCWDRWIDRYNSIHGRLWDKDHPDGEDFNCEITSIEVEDNDLVEIRDQGNGWNLHIGDHMGETTVTVHYTDHTGKEEQYGFMISISGDVYNVWFDFDRGLDHLQDGKSTFAAANSRHEVYRDGEGHHDAPADRVTYEWHVIEGAEFVTVLPDPNDSSKLNISAGMFGDGRNRKVVIELTAFDEDENGSRFEIGRHTRDLWISSDYTELYPALIDDLTLKTFKDVTVDYYHFFMDDEGNAQQELMDGSLLQYAWEYNVDQIIIANEAGNILSPDEGPDGEGNAVIRFEGNHNDFKIARLTPDDCWLRLVCWNDFNRDGNWEDDWRRDYWFGNAWRGLEYDGLREGSHTYVFDNEQSTLTVNDDDLKDLDYELAVSAGYYVDDEFVLIENSGDFVRRSGRVILIEGQGMAGNQTVCDRGGFELKTEAYVTNLAGDKIPVADCSNWVEYRVSEQNPQFPTWGEMLLPGWDFGFDNEMGCHVRNADYPYGDMVTLRITDVTAQGNDGILEEEVQDGHWHYRALKMGTVHFILTYEDVYGESRTHEFDVNVTGDVYHCWLTSYSSDGSIAPGETLGIYGSADHSRCRVDEQGNEEYSMVPVGNLLYEWSIDADDWADHLEVVKGTVGVPSSERQFSVRAKAAGSDWWESRIRLKIYDPDETMDYPMAQTDTRIFVGNDFFRVEPAWWNITMGRYRNEFMIDNLKLFHVFIDDQGELKEEEITDNIQFRWNYDRNNLLVTDPEGNEIPPYEGDTDGLTEGAFTEGRYVLISAKDYFNDQYIRVNTQLQNENGDWFDVSGMNINIRMPYCDGDHEFGDPQWYWDDRTHTAVLELVCYHSYDEIATPDVLVEGPFTQEATVLAEGRVYYTAMSIFGGRKYTDERTTEVIPKLTPTISLSSEAVTLTVPGSTTIEVTGLAAGDGVASWTSADASIASVENGKITAKKAGNTTVTVTLLSGLTADVKVTVKSSMVAPAMNAVFNSAKGGDIRWKAVSECVGYKVYRQRSSEGIKLIATISDPATLQCYDPSIKDNCWGCVYHYYVTALYKNGSKTVEGPKSEKLVLQRLAPMKITKLTNSAKNTVSLTWACTAKENKALGYEIQYAESSSDLYNRKGTFKAVSIDGRNNLTTTIKKLTKGKTYWFRVRCYVNYTHSVTHETTKTWSQYSSVESIKISK